MAEGEGRDRDCSGIEALVCAVKAREEASTIKRLEDNVIIITDNMKDVDYGG